MTGGTVNMQGLERDRRPVRKEFTVLHGQLEKLLKAEKLDGDYVRAKFKLLTDSYEQLQIIDAKIKGQIAEEGLGEEEEDAEYEKNREFKMKYESLRVMKERLLPERTQAYSESVSGGEFKLRNFKLPTLQMKKFSGQLVDWLAFWAQFQKIDEDVHMCGSDKFQYLLQSLEPGTDAHEIASGYPQSNENYQKVIDALKKRYGSEDMLLQVYIRQLLNLVISNVQAKDKVPVKTLYHKLDSHIRALKTLNLEKADPATWLFPLVESSLPEQVLDNWQRSPLSTHDGSKDDPQRTRLDILMSFLEREVEIKQKIDITRSFANDQNQHEKLEKKRVISQPTSTRKPEKSANIPTLSSFQNVENSRGREREKCVFCNLTNHPSHACYKARKMSYESRMAILREKKLCFRCCGPHLGRDCPEKQLECKICKRSHRTILCRDYKRKSDEDSYSQRTAKKVRMETENVPITSTNANSECSTDVVLQTLIVKVVHQGQGYLVRAFIDSGSQRSYILEKVTKQLNMEPVGSTKVIHSMFGDTRSAIIDHNLYDVNLKSISGTFEQQFTMREHDKLCGNLPVITQPPNLREELRVYNIELSDVSPKCTEIEILIGADIYAHIVTGEMVKLNCGAVAINTKLGWTVLGEVNEIEKNENQSMACFSLSMSVSDSCVTKLWDLEMLGIREPVEEITLKREKELARENYISSISRDETGMYSVKLPWKENLPPIPHNREVAFKRLQSATRKVMYQNLYDSYDKVFKEWLTEGIIEEVSDNDGAISIHYLPHRPVVKDSVTTPVRPVFDASCRVGKSPSINDCLYTGENYVELIPEIMMRFREKNVGFSADIKKAFLTIGVHPDDRDMLRFLWWAESEQKKLIEFRHARVVFGVTCSPFILGVVLFLHLTTLPDEEKEFGEKLLQTFYVDNSIGSEDTKEEYMEFKQKAAEILKRAKMDLRLWCSNVEEINEESSRVISVLGLNWDRENDNLFVNIKKLSMPEKVTKRSILSTIQKIFDPIGFTSPCLLPMKILLQKTWIRKVKWDDVLPEEESKLFWKWCHEALELDKVKIPRVATGGITDRKFWSFHIFTDTSKIAYSAAVFLRVGDDNRVTVQLVSAKSRVAPVKKMTIPKLELMGCLLGVRLAASVKRALRVDGDLETYWCDSTTALAWIRRNDQWGTFVHNRTKEINERSNAENWRYVPSEYNPADLPSRGCTPAQLFRSKWWEGPSWLYSTENLWPQASEIYDEQDIASERIKTTPPIITSFSVIDRVRNQHTFLARVRIVGYVRRFLYNYLVKNITLRRKGPLTQQELEKAELILLREVQREAFPVNKRENLQDLELFEDEWGLLRVRTRLTYRKDLANFRFPIILPNKNDITKQLIRDCHRAYCHAGIGFLVTKLRLKYWVLKPRHTVRSVIYSCERCSRYTAKAVIPAPAPLPLDRVKNAEIWEVVGVDLAGPLIVKGGKKAWIVIFTCAVYRAVHFELVSTISTKSFIEALETFVEKFRRPAIIYSDNGTNFKGADNLFKKIDWKEVDQNQRVPQIKWKFNPVTSSWWGGFWERLIRSTKDLLKRTIGKGSVQWKELKAILKTVAEVINSRPLTYVSDDTNDLEPLTPALFLHPFGRAELPERELTEADKFRFRLKYLNTLRTELKNRFLREYLSMLVNRNPKRATKRLNLGELVLVGYDGVKRIEWPLGRVTELIPGKDGVVRLARVRTEKGEILRSVQRLYPLELNELNETSKTLREKGVVTRSGRVVRRPERYEHNDTSKTLRGKGVVTRRGM